jgi:hypothetical protein
MNGAGGESEHSRILKTRNLLIFKDAQTSENAKIAVLRYTAGTRHLFSFCSLFDMMHFMIGEPVMTASSARCRNSPAWVVLHGSRTSHVSAGTYEFSCPVEGCGAVTRVGNDQAELFEIPERWFSRLREISDAWTPSGFRVPI